MGSDNNALRVGAGVAAVVGSAVAADGAVITGEIQWTGSPGHVSEPRPDEPFGLNLDGIAGDDYFLTSNYKDKPENPSFDGKYDSTQITAFSPNLVSDAKYMGGHAVGPSDFTLMSTTTSVVKSPFISSSDYIGLRFGNGPSYNYGWIQLDEGENDNFYDLVRYGYETTPDTPIVTPIPEPAGLAALAMGAVALLRRRGSRA